MELRNLLLILAAAQQIEGEFLGCYEDNVTPLMPDFLLIMHTINSPAKCMYVCQKLQYQYAGVESGDKCFCSIGKPYENMKRDIKECNTNCPFSTEICGGPSRLSAYSVDSTVFPTTGEGIYIGCYRHTPEKMVMNFAMIVDQTNNPKRCVHFCTVLGYLYAAPEGSSGDRCYCGNEEPPVYMKANENECNVNCPYSQEKCGGDWRLAIYRTSVDPNSESIITVSDERLERNAIGCFEDSEPRTLAEYYMSLQYSSNSPKTCLYVCQQFGYQYAGVQDGKQCFCGNQRPNESLKRDHTECNMFCPYSIEKCGGEMRNFIYSTQSNFIQVQEDY